MKWRCNLFFDLPSIFTSVLYFVLVFIFVMNRTRILDIIGKILTPAILLVLLLIIGITLFSADYIFGETVFESPFSHGILEGYQTFDAIGAVVVGGVIIVSINLRKEPGNYEAKKRLIARAGWLAGLGLFLVYAGLIITGALLHSEFDKDISRTALLSGDKCRATWEYGKSLFERSGSTGLFYHSSWDSNRNC